MQIWNLIVYAIAYIFGEGSVANITKKIAVMADELDNLTGILEQANEGKVVVQAKANDAAIRKTSKIEVKRDKKVRKMGEQIISNESEIFQAKRVSAKIKDLVS